MAWCAFNLVSYATMIDRATTALSTLFCVARETRADADLSHGCQRASGPVQLLGRTSRVQRHQRDPGGSHLRPRARPRLNVSRRALEAGRGASAHAVDDRAPWSTDRVGGGRPNFDTSLEFDLRPPGRA